MWNDEMWKRLSWGQFTSSFSHEIICRFRSPIAMFVVTFQFIKLCRQEEHKSNISVSVSLFGRSLHQWDDKTKIKDQEKSSHSLQIRWNWPLCRMSLHTYVNTWMKFWMIYMWSLCVIAFNTYVSFFTWKIRNEMRWKTGRNHKSIFDLSFCADR